MDIEKLLLLLHHKIKIGRNMKRLIYNELLEWKKSATHKPLVLLGVRQVGKTYILKEFGQNEFPEMVYINCHKDAFAPILFRDLDASRIISEIESHYNVDIKEGGTFVFFDEIQEVKNGLASLKYFCEDHPALHVAVAGSLLGISMREDESYPVGKIKTLRLYPMTFSEYLMALGREKLLALVERLKYKSLAAQNELLVSLLRSYFFVGGMPEAVKDYVEFHDARRVRAIQSEIIDAYKKDMAKHTKPQTQRINMVWDSIPSQLARENKKFVFGAVKKGGRAADFELAIQWLVDAGIVYKVYRTKEPTRPLKFYEDNNAFKLYIADCGLLACMSNAVPGEMLIGSNVFEEFKGALVENYVLQQMKPYSHQNDVFYYSKENSSQEIDFLLETEERIIPMEVKASVSVKSKSFTGFINTDYKDSHFKGLRLSLLPYIDQGWMENVPLYVAEAFFSECTKSGPV